MQQSRVIPSPRSFACDLATLCAPTLAGLKPASLFRYQPAPGQDAAAMAAAWHAALSPRGVTVRVLKPAGGCHRVHPKPRQKLYRVRLLEGLHRSHRCAGRV